MAYVKARENWTDYPDTTTPMLAEHANHIEDGLVAAAATADEALADAATAQVTADTAITNAATVQTNLTNHDADTTNVHGIANTALLETTAGAQAKADAKVTQTITNGVTTTAPSEDAVFDALALKLNASKLSVQNTEPVSPATNDLWVDTS